MDKLKQQITDSAYALQEAWKGVRSMKSSQLPIECYKIWEEKTGLHQTLLETRELFTPLEAARNALDEVINPDNVRNAEENIINYANSDMKYWVARHIALVPFVTVSWSIYDRLANVCGRLAAIDSIAQDPRINPKPNSHLLDGKNLIGFRFHSHLKHAYAWPLTLSYKIRNLLTHEGHKNDQIALFKSENISDGFMLHPNAVLYLQNECEYSENDGKIYGCCLPADEECWPTGNLLTILEKYHHEIDIMFIGLVKWCGNSLVNQINAFADRDIGKTV